MKTILLKLQQYYKTPNPTHFGELLTHHQEASFDIYNALTEAL